MLALQAQEHHIHQGQGKNVNNFQNLNGNLDGKYLKNSEKHAFGDKQLLNLYIKYIKVK